MPSSFPFFAFVTLTLFACSSSSLHQSFNVSNEKDFLLDRYWSIGTSSPVSRSIRNNISAKRRLFPLFQLYSTLGNLVSTRRQTNHHDACNTRVNDDWSRQVRNVAFALQIARLATDCISFVDINAAVENGELEPNLLKTMKITMKKARKALYDAIRSIPLPSDGNWTDPQGPTFAPHARTRRYDTHRCAVFSTSAFLFKRQWFLRASMTNHRPSLNLFNGFRHIAQEWVPRTYRKSLSMIHPSLLEPNKLEKSTTVVEVTGGLLKPDVTLMSSTNFRSPLNIAYRQSSVQGNQALDSLYPSNIAILALPMVMNFVPFSFLGDLNTFGMVFYVAFTDIISSVPFLIKGVELVHLARATNPVARSSFIGNETHGFMELWVVECSGHPKFRRYGKTFIGIAIVCMVCGALIELWAMAIMKRRKRLGSQAPFFEKFDSENHQSRALMTEYDEFEDWKLSRASSPSTASLYLSKSQPDHACTNSSSRVSLDEPECCQAYH